MTTPVGGTRLRSRIRSAANLFTKKNRFPNNRNANHLSLHQSKNSTQIKNHQKCCYSLRNNHHKNSVIANNNCLNDNTILSDRRGGGGGGSSSSNNSGECCKTEAVRNININEKYKGPFAR